MTIEDAPVAYGPTSPAARFAASYCVLLAAHDLADYWVQTHHQATNKGRHGDSQENTAGRRAAIAHVLVYTSLSTAAICTATTMWNLHLDRKAILAGQAISAASHYFADRRYTLRKLAAQTGRLEFHDTFGGAVLDQSWHRVWLGVAAATTARKQKPRA